MSNKISVEEDNLAEVKYAWAKDDNEPSYDTKFSDEELANKSADVSKNVTSDDIGTWYLYVKATDLAGNETTKKSGEFLVRKAISFNTDNGSVINSVKESGGVYYIVVQPGTSAGNLLKYISSPYNVGITTGDGKTQIAGNTMLATNEIITLDGIDANAIIVVKGDVYSDGNVNMQDLIKLNQARLNKITLNTAELIAADINESGNVDFADLIQVNQYRLGNVSKL